MISAQSDVPGPAIVAQASNSPNSTLVWFMDGIPSQVVAATTTDVPSNNGYVFYNDASDYYCFCNGSGDDVQMHNPTAACF